MPCSNRLVEKHQGGLQSVLAWSAHEAFRQIAANDAISIAECINRQYVRRRLAAQFPGQPVLVYFTLTPPVINDRAATVNMLCQLAGQRWRATDEAVSEEIGVEVHTEEVRLTNDDVPVMNERGMPGFVGTESRSGYAEARPSETPGLGGVVANALSDLEVGADGEPPLTEDELAAFRGLSEPNRERMEQYRAEVEQALRAAADLDAPADDEEEEVVVNGCTKPGCPKHPRKGDSTGAMRPKQKGGRSSKGKADFGKTGSPKLAEPGDSERKVKDVLQRGFEDAKKGKKVSTGVQVGSHEVVFAPGDVENWGTHHAERPEHPRKISSERLSETVLHGERKNARRNEVTMTRKDDVVILDPERQPSIAPGEGLNPKKSNERLVGKNWLKK